MRINQVNVGNQPMTNTGTEAANKPTESKTAITKPIEKIKSETTIKNSQKEENDQKVVDDEILKKSVEQANKSLEIYNRVIERSVHSKTHTIMYTVKDSKTGEVIQEFPPKKIQDMIAKMWELAGLFVDEKA
ncbi:flagellar protein FlaG [Fusibacter bizertensis]